MSAQEPQPQLGLAPLTVGYNIWVHTSQCKGAGTAGNVCLELHGQQGSSGMCTLKGSPEQGFAKGQVRVNKHIPLFAEVCVFACV